MCFRHFSPLMILILSKYVFDKLPDVQKKNGNVGSFHNDMHKIPFIVLYCYYILLCSSSTFHT